MLGEPKLPNISRFFFLILDILGLYMDISQLHLLKKKITNEDNYCGTFSSQLKSVLQLFKLELVHILVLWVWFSLTHML